MIYTGFQISQYYKKRCMLLDDTVLFLNRLKIDFRYSSLTIYDVLKGYCDEIQRSNASYIRRCCEYIETGNDFPVAFQKAVCEDRLLSREEKSRLIFFGGSLGTSCVETQTELISYYTELFQKNYEESLVICDKNSKAAFIICTFIGIGLYIISV